MTPDRVPERICICPGDVCLGDRTDPNTCQVCADLDGEEHCPRCPCDDCEDEAPGWCPIGVDGHHWVLVLHEGTEIQLAPGETCTGTCEEFIRSYGGDDWMTERPIPVRVTFKPDHPNLGGYHGDTPCDCGWWFVVAFDAVVQP